MVTSASNGVVIHASGLVLSPSWAVWVPHHTCDWNDTEFSTARESGGHLKAMRHPISRYSDENKISRDPNVQGIAC